MEKSAATRVVRIHIGHTTTCMRRAKVRAWHDKGACHHAIVNLFNLYFRIYMAYLCIEKVHASRHLSGASARAKVKYETVKRMPWQFAGVRKVTRIHGY